MSGTIAVTASRQGPTAEQTVALCSYLKDSEATTLVHGECVGGDVVAAGIAWGFGYTVEARPASDVAPKWRAKTRAHIRHEPEPALRRNKKAVDQADELVALPKEVREPKPARGQGTWSTVRYARKKHKPVTVIWPDGYVEHE